MILAKFNVGTAFLQVTASVANIHKTIAAEVAKIKDIQIDVTPNLEGFAEAVAAESARLGGIEIDVTPNVAGFRDKVKAATAGLSDVDVNVKPDTTGFKEKVKAEIRGIGSMDVPITVDTTRANAQVGAFATELRAKLTAATTALGDIHMTADSSDVDRKIAAIRAQLVTLANQRIGVDIDSAAASAKVAELKAKLDELGAKSPNIQVKVDVAKATAELAAFRTVLSGTTNDGNLVSRALGGLVTAIGSGISSLGSFVGSAAGVGSALTSMGSSVTGAAGSFAGFGQSVGSALSSALPFLATAAQWTAMGVAIAGAGAIAVGGIGQIGGAAVALASGIVPLVTSLGLLPGLLAPIGIGLGTLALGFSNTGKSGLEFKNTMDQLKTAFDPVVKAIQSQMQPAVQSFIQAISGLAPVVQQVLPQITSAVSQVTNSFSQMFKSSSFKSDLTTLLSGAATNIKTFGDAAKNAFQGFMNIMVAAEPAVTRIATDLDQAAQKFNAWTAAARQSGELTTIFQQAATVLEQLGNTVTNLAGLFKDLWDSANRTGAFTATLDAINTGITQFRDYVTQAGGAWDTLMSKAGSVTQSLVGLVGSIGNAFTTLGGQIDISGVIDKITDAIHNVTPAFASIGQAATPVFENIITIIGRVVEALGPTVTQAIQEFGQTLQNIDWESLTVKVAEFIKGITDTIAVFQNIGDTVVSVGSALKQLATGDLSGAVQTMEDLGQRTQDMLNAIHDNSGIDATKQSIQGLNAAIQGVPETHGTQFNADGSPLQSTAQQAQGWIAGVSGDWNTTFTGDATSVQAAAGLAKTGVMGVPQSWMSQFVGDVAGIAAAAGQASQSLEGVPSTHGSSFTGDASGLTAAASSGTSAVQGVPETHSTTFTGAADAATGGLLSVVQAAAAAITGVPDTKATTITGDNSNLTAAAQGSIDALNGIVDKAVNITANNSQALSAIQQVQQQLNSLQDKTVTVTVQTVQAGAGGMITGPSGGVLPMASGGALTPMSGSSARIVGPNTWRVIGDRPSGDELFLPLNRSATSIGLLGVGANRMGFGLVPMSSGGFSSRDGRAWDWLEELLGRHRHGHGGGSDAPLTPQLRQTVGQPYTAGFGVGNSVGLSGSALPITPAMLSTTYYPGTRDIPNPGSSGRTGRNGQDPIVIRFEPTGDKLIDAVFNQLRHRIRVQGGNVQLSLGQ